MRLTVKAIAGLKMPAGKRDHIEFDSAIPGFGLRLREGGTRTWIYQYSLGTKQRRITLGKASALTPDKARAVAANLHAKTRLGGDPALDKETARRDAENTLGALVDQYLAARKSEWRPRSEVEITRHLTKHAKPLHKIPITAVSQRNVANLLNDIAKDAGNVTANRVRASLCAFLGWIIREGIRLPEGNVASYTNKREEKSRARVLNDSELSTIWHALEADHYGTIIKLLMLTGLRANEVAGLRWSEIDFERELILLPAERTKNARPHQVPMSNTVHALLKEQEKHNGRELVFGYGGDGPFSGWSRAKQALDERIAKAGRALSHWTPHDLRRTAATRMADLEIQPHIIEAVLNHVSGHKGGIAGIYNRALYSAEKAQALARWANHIAAVISNRKSNVTPLTRRA